MKRNIFYKSEYFKYILLVIIIVSIKLGFIFFNRMKTNINKITIENSEIENVPIKKGI